MNTQISLVQWSLCFDEQLDSVTIEALQASVQEERKALLIEEGAAEEETVEEDLI